MLSEGHCGKNSGAQVSGASRTVHLGRVFVDLSGARAWGLPAAAFVRADHQSDSIQALLACPWHFVPDLNIPMDQVQVPWCTRGALLWSLSVALSWAPYTHKSLTAIERCELAVSGYVVWDLWRLVAARLEAEQEQKVGSMGMAMETVQNLQAASLSMITFLLSRQETCPWNLEQCQTKVRIETNCILTQHQGDSNDSLMMPDVYNLGIFDFCILQDSLQPWKHGFGRLTELSIETGFGDLRCKSLNSQLTVRSFSAFSASKALRDSQHAALSSKPVSGPGEPAVSKQQCPELYGKKCWYRCCVLLSLAGSLPL